MHLLFTNNTLQGLGGSELYVHDMALELQRRGHQVSCFSLDCGLVADKLREKGIGIATSVDELKALPPVDLIHAHHRLEARLAASCFPLVPIVYASLGPFHPLEQPGPDRGLFTRFIVLSQDIKNNLVRHQQIPAEKISIVPNFVDLSRFTAGRALGEKPRRALLLTNYFKPDKLLEEACKIAGVELKAIGAPGESVWNVEDYLNWADVVITSARGALQALAMGRATVVYRPAGSDGLITPANFEASMAYNLSGRAFANHYDEHGLAAQLTAYKVAEVQQLQQVVRSEFSLEQIADNLLAIYQQTLTEYRQQWPAGSESGRYSLVLSELGHYLTNFKDRDNLKAHFGFVVGSFGKAAHELNPQEQEILQFLEVTQAEINRRGEYQQNLEVYTNQLQHENVLYTQQIAVKSSQLEEATTRAEEASARIIELEQQHQELLNYTDWLRQRLGSVQADLQALLKTKTVRFSRKAGEVWQRFRPKSSRK